MAIEFSTLYFLPFIPSDHAENIFHSGEYFPFIQNDHEQLKGDLGQPALGSHEQPTFVLKLAKVNFM